jgi:Protein of unknown function (DUF1549)/Protein of unknown function (DUF1553)
MQQSSNKSLSILSHTLLMGVALGLMGCGSGGGSGGGGAASTVAPLSSGNGSGQIVGLSISPPEDITVDTGINSTFQVIVDGYYTNGQAVDLTRTVSYDVDDAAVATVSGDGMIEPKGVGTTTVTVKVQTAGGELTATKNVTVVSAPASAPQPNFVELTVYPKSRTLDLVNSGQSVDQLQQIVIVGMDDTGRIWDLTRVNGVQISDYTDPDLGPSTAGSLSPQGLFRGVMEGEQVLLVTRIDTAGLVAGSHIVLGNGQSKPVPPSALYSGMPLAGTGNAIDQAILLELSKQFIEPSGLSTDSEFLRRVYQDAIGRLPSQAEVEAFTADQSADKRSAVISQLVDSQAFADHWGKLLGEWFLVKDTTFDAWASTQLAAGATMTDIVTDLATGAGQGGQLFDTQHPTAANKVDILLLTGTGMTAECAQCHDHPVTGPNDTPKWTQAERFPLDAFFATTDEERQALDKQDNRFGPLYEPGFILDPTATVTTTYADPLAARRAEFAQLLTASDAFKRGFGHRIFSHVTVPLLDPNQFIAKNLDSVTIPTALDAITTGFGQSNTSLKEFCRDLFNSGYYQLTAVAVDATNDPLLARHLMERMQSEACESLVENVTGMPLNNRGFFRQTFGFPLDRDGIAERSVAVNMSQSLVLMNSPIVQDAVTNPAGRVALLATDVDAGAMTNQDAVTQLFRVALARDPIATEMTLCLDVIGQAGSTQAGLEDVAAVLMSTIEAVAH